MTCIESCIKSFSDAEEFNFDSHNTFLSNELSLLRRKYFNKLIITTNRWLLYGFYFKEAKMVNPVQDGPFWGC